MGKYDRYQAKQLCSSEGNAVSLPMPRFEEENEFYRVYFGDVSLWLNALDDVRGVRDETNDHYYMAQHALIHANYNQFEKTTGNMMAIFDIPYLNAKDPRAKYYDWVKMDLTSRFDEGLDFLNGVTMTYTGEWKSVDLDQMVNTICVYNIIPESCSKCPEQFFCRYQDNRIETECIEIDHDNVNDLQHYWGR